MVTLTNPNCFGQQIFVGLSTDNKPTKDIKNADIFMEMNTGKVYLYNEDGSAWVAFEASSN